MHVDVIWLMFVVVFLPVEQHYAGLVLSRRIDSSQSKIYAFYKQKNKDMGLDGHLWLPYVSQVCMVRLGKWENRGLKSFSMKKSSFLVPIRILTCFFVVVGLLSQILAVPKTTCSLAGRPRWTPDFTVETQTPGRISPSWLMWPQLVQTDGRKQRFMLSSGMNGKAQLCLSW